MSSDEFAIRARDVSKHYVMFARPEDRLKQMIVPRLQRAMGRTPTRYFRDFAALNNVSFDIRRGETVGIIGRNGSGKSTLLQIVCGTLQPTSGSIEVNGRIAALLELGAGFNPEFTGRENVYLNAAILGLSRAEIDERFESIARFADIGDFIEQPVKTYSSGMYVRLAFATAINVDPDILVVDEALSVGDEAFQRKCFARIEEIKERGGTILFVSHGVQTIVQLCDRAMLIDSGELILEGRPKMVVNQYQMMLNASAEAALKIRASILHLRDCASEPKTALDTDGQKHDDDAQDSKPEQAAVSPSLAAPQPSDDTEIFSDYYDPNLKPQSTIFFEERGARIRDLTVQTLNGQKVNVLSTGKRYVFQYFVEFLETSHDIGCGFFFRTVEGFEIGGLHTFHFPENRIKRIEKRQGLSARFEFRCVMLPGVYFLTCGVIGIKGGEQVVLHRIKDAFVIRVVNDPRSPAVGLCDLEALHRLEKADIQNA